MADPVAKNQTNDHVNGSTAMSSILLKGQVGLVTGAGSPYGIGRSLVLALAAAGARAVYACDLNKSAIPSLQEEVKNAGYDTIIEGRFLDVSIEDQTLAVVKEITKAHGRFDFFFANAGFANYRNLNDMESQHYDRQVNVMQRAVFLAIKYGSQAMMVTSPEKTTPGGTLVVTSSSASFLGAYADLAYTAAKTAVNGLVMGGSVQLSTSNIRINGIAPGFTQTSILTSSKDAEKGDQYKVDADNSKIRKNHEWFFEQSGLLRQREYYYSRTAEPEEIANIGVFLASDLSSAINGQIILADSGRTAAATGEACTGPIPIVKAMDLD